jgi:hypothetical protein
MLDRDRIDPQYLCFPQIADGTSAEKSIVITALEQVLLRLDVSKHPVLIKPEQPESPEYSKALIYFDIEKLLKVLNEENRQTPICMMSTLSKNDAIAYSYQEIGLNLFDLPWFSEPDQKVFRYVNLLELDEQKDELTSCFAQTETINNSNFVEAAKHLRWAKCHQLARGIQESVGHGQRDVLQNPKVTLKDMQDAIQYVKKKHENLPCGDSCQLSCDIQKTIEIENGLIEDDRIDRAQKIAALDCQKYRFAQTLYIPAELPLPKFKKIIVLDDNPKFKKTLTQKFLELNTLKSNTTKIIDNKVDIILVNEMLCWNKFGIFDKKLNKQGKSEKYDLIHEYKKDFLPAEILTCFDLDLGSPSASDPEDGLQNEFIKTCFGGHWVLYGTTREHPDVARLVITGFRSQELLSYTAGGSAYLLKPITTENLLEKVIEASVLHRVTWLCPQEIQTDYGESINSLLGGNLSFESSIEKHLTNWLKWRRIDLKVIDRTDFNKGSVCESEVIVIDLFNINKPEINIEESIAKIAEIRQLNPHASMVVILPLAEGVNDPFASYYRQLPLNLRDGSDLIIRKPMWIADHPQHELALGSAIVHQLKRLEDYDTKYQVLIPIASLLENSSEASSNLNLVDSMKALSDANPLEHPSEASKNLINAMKAHGNASQTISDKIIKPLTQVFGGVSSYELGIRGSWYDAESKKIDDTIIVVEFCAKSSLMAKEFIEKTVVRYLKQIAGEDIVLLQEIPIRGRLL